MARSDRNQNLTLRPSVLDRLLDDEPQLSREAPLTMEQAFRVIVRAVQRDLECLLNTRTTWLSDALQRSELASRSVAAYGLPDFSHESFKNGDARVRFTRAVERIIATFEPRLRRVNVVPNPPGPDERHFSFRIDAVLCVDPIREAVSFDSVLESNGITRVSQA